MSHDLPKSLVIISDTAMWENTDGIFVFEPVLREVEALTKLFSTITWLGYNYGNTPPISARKTENESIRFVLLPMAVGGKRWRDKIKILFFIPSILKLIRKHILQHKYVHTRGPSLPALLTIIYSTFDSDRKYWHKYAGNWRQRDLPLAYALQRWLLKRNRHFVAVNGRLESDSDAVHTVENPCFSESELAEAQKTARQRNFQHEPLKLLFVGRIEEAKGGISLLKAFLKVRNGFSMTMVGSGSAMTEAAGIIKENNLPVSLIGVVNREHLNQLYRAADILILPSKAEGFPKVIAEAAGYGCIPVMTNISAVQDYLIHGKNSILLPDNSPESIISVLSKLPSHESMNEISKEAGEMAKAFTYEHYIRRLRTEFLKS